jgi:hypothetical protein
MAIASIGCALPACTEPPQPAVNSSATNSFAYEPSGPVARAPLSPLAGSGSQPGYGSPPPHGTSQLPMPPYGNSSEPLPPYADSYGGADPQTAELQGWRASPRWSAIEGEGCIEVEENRRMQDGESESARMQVETCAKGSPGGEAPAPAETMAPPDD